MNHEHFREQIALRLYGELDVDETRALDLHVGGCADCRAFEARLGDGLGRVRELARTHGDVELPADWSERLREATRPSRRLSPWWTAVTSFAAGILVTALALHRGDAPASTSNDPRPTADESSYAHYLSETPPPPATGSGQLARLSAYLKR